FSCRMSSWERQPHEPVLAKNCSLWTVSTPDHSCICPATLTDADWRQNPHVARALAEATQALVEAGYTVVVETWDASQGKGIDDVLAAGHRPALQSTAPRLHKEASLPA